MKDIIHFYYEGNIFPINCYMEDKMEDIFKLIAEKTGININRLSILLNEENIKPEKKISELRLLFGNNILLYVHELKNKQKNSEIFLEEENDSIEIRYKINKNLKNIKIFGADFVENNKNNCKIILMIFQNGIYLISMI